MVARVLVALIATVLVAACDSPTSPSQPRVVRVAPEWVTGAAAAAVDPTTRLFVFSHAGSSLTRQGADSAALAYVRFVLNPGTLGNGRASLEADRGAAVAAWNDLRVCGRPLWVRSPFGSPSVPAPRNTLRLMRSAWAHTLCGPRGDPQVAVHTVDVQTGSRYLGPDYRIEDLDSIGQVHAIFGIPLVGRGPVPWPAPESALQALFAHTGVPISEIPEAQIHLFPPPTVAWLPVWRFRMSVPVSGTLDGGEVLPAIRDVYARLVADDSLAFFVPAAVQPPVVWVPNPVSFDPFVLDSIPFPVERPVVFRRIRPQ